MDPAELESTIQIGRDIQLYKRFLIAGFSVLWFDYSLTFSEEIRLFWKQRITPLSLLFFFNRYYALASSIVVMFMMFHPSLNHGTGCDTIAPFLPFGFALISWTSVSGLMIARIHAIYGQDRRIGSFLLIWLFAICLAIVLPYSFPGAKHILLPDIPLDTFRACIASAPSSVGKASAVWVLLICGFDAMCVVLLVVNVCTRERVNNDNLSLLELILRDGVLYFVSVFSLSFTFMIMVFAARPGRQYIMGVPSAVMSIVMSGRVTLNLRNVVKEGRGTNSNTRSIDNVIVLRPHLSSRPSDSSRSDFFDAGYEVDLTDNWSRFSDEGCKTWHNGNYV